MSRLVAMAALAVFCGSVAWAATIEIDASDAGRMQVIDGFGTCHGNPLASQEWYQQMYYDELGSSMMRMDLTPHFVSPYSDTNYNSPWFMGSGTKSVFNFEDKANPDGPEKNRVRTYTNPEDYSREFGGKKAPIAVMGPDINKNIQLFDYKAVKAMGDLAQAGLARKQKLGDFKLYGSIWSPAPWVKYSSENKIGKEPWPHPVEGTPWPFIWGGNFSGGRLDVSEKPLEIFNDGTGPTSSLTQFARGTAAYIKGFQDTYKVQFYAISIQNEVNFEEFYNSCTYPLSEQYIKALKAVRAEFDKYPDLKPIQIIGPEDLLGDNGWVMWQLGGDGKLTHKNLQYLQHIAADPVAAKAVSFFCIHGYASDGSTAVGADSRQWRWWAQGWDEAPAQGLPEQVKGFMDYGKRSWMTETSGERGGWLEPKQGFPGNGAWSIALKNQQALTAGRQSAILYWQFADKEEAVTGSALASRKVGLQEPKLVAARHFYRFIRPGAVAVKCTADAEDGVTGSAYVHDANRTLTVVLVNKSAEARPATIKLPAGFSQVQSLDAYTSSEKALWVQSQASAANGVLKVDVPGYGVVTVTNAK